MSKRPIPMTSCTVCRKPGYYVGFINSRCFNIVNGKRCPGKNRIATQETYWVECASCKATGWTGETCKQCDGTGWIFEAVRPAGPGVHPAALALKRAWSTLRNR